MTPSTVAKPKSYFTTAFNQPVYEQGVPPPSNQEKRTTNSSKDLIFVTLIAVPLVVSQIS